jgi:acylphosphatase
VDGGEEVFRRFVVHGRVQGVGFRDAVCRFAWRLGGLKGHVRNLRDSSVEVCVAAEPAKIEELRAFLHRGPPLARVDRLDEQPLAQPAPRGPFCIVYGG